MSRINRRPCDSFQRYDLTGRYLYRVSSGSAQAPPPETTVGEAVYRVAYRRDITARGHPGRRICRMQAGKMFILQTYDMRTTYPSGSYRFLLHPQPHVYSTHTVHNSRLSLLKIFPLRFGPLCPEDRKIPQDMQIRCDRYVRPIYICSVLPTVSTLDLCRKVLPEHATGHGRQNGASLYKISFACSSP